MTKEDIKKTLSHSWKKNLYFTKFKEENQYFAKFEG